MKSKPILVMHEDDTRYGLDAQFSILMRTMHKTFSYVCMYLYERSIVPRCTKVSKIGQDWHISLLVDQIKHVLKSMSFMHSPCAPCLDAMYWILRYLKCSPGKGILESKKCLQIKVGHLAV